MIDKEYEIYKILLNRLIGKRVSNKSLGLGIVMKVDSSYVFVSFNGDEKQMQTSTFFDYNSPVDPEIAAELQVVNKKYEKYKAEEAKTRATELAEQRKREAEENTKKVTYKKAKGKKPFNEKFGKDYNFALLKRNPRLSYHDVELEHGINISGFGRGINVKSDRVVLISSISSGREHFTYHDKWNNYGYYEYSGEGKNGDQQLTKGNNEIAQAEVNGKTLYLYVKFGPTEYYPPGVMKLVDYNLIDAPGEDGKMRKEYQFILDRV